MSSLDPTATTSLNPASTANRPTTAAAAGNRRARGGFRDKDNDSASAGGSLAAALAGGRGARGVVLPPGCELFAVEGYETGFEANAEEELLAM